MLYENVKTFSCDNARYSSINNKRNRMTDALK